MNHSTGTPTKAQRERMDAIKYGPCLCCKQRKLRSYAPDIHHLLSGNRRRGHGFTIGLCAWHHRAAVAEWATRSEMFAMYGPSLADGSKPFHEAFGSDDELLALQNELIGVPA